MEPRPSRTVAGPASPAGAAARPARRRHPADGYALVESTPDEPLAVVVAGPSGSGRRAVLDALLADTGPVPGVPGGSFLVAGYASRVGGAAYVPGYREPYEYRSHPAGVEPALARPPRRVELRVPNPILRHFHLVDTPDVSTLGVAGGAVLLDAVRRGGALLFVVPADLPLTPADLNLLGQVADTAAVFFVVTPAADGGRSGADPTDSTTTWMAQHRIALAAAIPGLVDAPWCPLDPATGDTAYLRRALLDWAAVESLRRSGTNPPVPPGATETVRVAPGAGRSGWADRLDRQVHTHAHRIRQHIALELANTHLRCVQEIVFWSGCAGLPELLDHELHALSLRAVAECDAAVEQIMDEAIALIFGGPPLEGVRRRVAAAVGWGLADQRGARDLDRVLLVTAGAEVEPVTGLGAVAALDAYPGGRRRVVLPPVGAGLAGGCYQHWRNPAHQDPAWARSWLQRAVREVELEMSREMARRLRAVQASLTGVLAEAIEHGILMA